MQLQHTHTHRAPCLQLVNGKRGVRSKLVSVGCLCLSLSRSLLSFRDSTLCGMQLTLRAAKCGLCVHESVHVHVCKCVHVSMHVSMHVSRSR